MSLKGVRDQIKKMAIGGNGDGKKEDFYAVSSSEADESEDESESTSRTSIIGSHSASIPYHAVCIFAKVRMNVYLPHHVLPSPEMRPTLKSLYPHDSAFPEPAA